MKGNYGYHFVIEVTPMLEVISLQVYHALHVSETCMYTLLY
jgi:hypothetical protein